MTSTNIVRHEYNGFQIPQRETDQYVSLTAMAQAEGKWVNDWARQSSTKEYLTELSTDTGIPLSALVKVYKGGSGIQGSWAHPEVALDFAQWVSPRFRVWANRTLRKAVEQKTEPPVLGIDWQAIAELRRQVESTSDHELKQLLLKVAADALGQEYEIKPKPKAKKGDRTFSVPQQPAGISHMQSFLEHGAYIKKTDDPKDFVTTANLFAAYQVYLKDYPLLPESGQTPCLNLIGFGKRFSSAHGTPSVFKKMRNRKLKGHAGIALGELALID